MAHDENHANGEEAHNRRKPKPFLVPDGQNSSWFLLSDQLYPTLDASCLLLLLLLRVKCLLTMFITVRMNLWAASAPWYCTMSVSATTRVSTVYSLVRRIAFLLSRQSLVGFTFFCLFFSEKPEYLLRLADHNKALLPFPTNILVRIQVVTTFKLKCSWLVEEATKRFHCRKQQMMCKEGKGWEKEMLKERKRLTVIQIKMLRIS